MSNGRILLLENIHVGAKANLESRGYEVELLPKALPEADLVKAIKGVTAIGLRSKTQLTSKVLEAADSLKAIGAFCIGTNQINLDDAHHRGIPVFNAPFSNTRSVAEMVLADVVFLARKLGDRNNQMHQRIWKKSSDGCMEVRGKTLGIIGYGHIGRQVGVLAEAFGLRVRFYDIASQLPMGNNLPAASLEELLGESDFVSLHVPATPQTKEMIGEIQISNMKRGSYLLNLSRGNVVVIDALVSALESGHLAGAALDVYPVEPGSNDDIFDSPLPGLPNVLLSPHVGGSTQEAQVSIGREVSNSLINYFSLGSTAGAVNFPQADLGGIDGVHRIAHIHRNVPGVLNQVHSILAAQGANILAQVLVTDPELGYLLMDVDDHLGKGICAELSKLDTTVRAQLLY